MTYKKYKAALFDLDGVIVDTAKYHYLAWKRLAKELGFDFTEKDNERLKGVSRMRSLEILLEVGGLSFSEEEKIKLAEKKNNWYVEYITKMDESEILPGAKECLIKLREKGVKISLCSASKNAQLILNNLRIKDLFDAIIDGTKTSKAKPDPEVFLLGAKELNILPEECVVFEDAEAGIQAAKSANMFAVGIGDEKILSKADIVIKGLHEFDVDMLF
ncbi:beta-phosphoglucomutase [Caldicellulosiruptoraceae bacterium PP1]